MIRGERRFDGCKNKNFAAWTNLEYCSAAVAHIKILAAVEGDARSDAHPLDPLLRAALGRNAVNRAVVPVGDEKIPLAAHDKAAVMHERCDERLYAVVRCNFIERNGNALSAVARKRNV